MFQHKLNDEVSHRTYLDWFVLSFLAGNINAGGYLACHRFVSHVTGFATMSGILLEQKEWLEAFGTLLIPAFFLIGVIISGYLTEKQYAHKVHGQRYAPVMWLVSLILFFVSIGGYAGWFGNFGDVASMKHSFILLASLCGACGLQNAAITSASGSTVRTTHLTGITTDLGLGIVKSEFKSLNKEQKDNERKANLLRAATIISFTSGSLVGAFAFTKFGYLGFIMPAIVSQYSALRANQNN